MSYDLGRALVTKLLETKDVRTVMKHRHVMSYLETRDDADAKEVLEFILDRFTERGRVPSSTLVGNRFPEFELEDTDDELEDILGQLKERRVYGDLQAAVANIAEEADSDPLAGLEAIKNHAADLAVKFSSDDILDSKLGAGVVLERYEEFEKGGGLLGLPWLWPRLNQATRGLRKGHWNVFYGDPGCLSGETNLWYGRGNRYGGRPIKLKDFFAKFHGHDLPGKGNARKWLKTDRTFLQSIDEDGSVFFNEVMDVFESGVKDVVELTFDDGTSLRLTPDHPVATTTGYIEAGSLTKTHRILAKGTQRPRGKGGRGPRSKRKHVCVKFHPNVVLQHHGWAQIARARLVVEARMNDVEYGEYVQALKKDPSSLGRFKFLSPDEEVHHKNGDTLDDRLSNLEVLSGPEHLRKHVDVSKANLNVDYLREVRLISRKKAGREMTYDIQMRSPANNFAANGVFVHNTMKTWNLIAIGDHVVEVSNARVYFCSGEMGKEDILLRLAAYRAKLDYEKFLAGALSPKEKKRLQRAVEQLMDEGDNGNFIIDELETTGKAAVVEMGAKIKEFGCDLAIFDSFADLADSPAWEDFWDLTRSIKRMLKSQGVPGVGSHHTNRDRKKKDNDGGGASDVALGDSLIRRVDAMFRLIRTPQDEENQEILIKSRKIREGRPCSVVINAKPAVDFSQKHVPDEEDGALDGEEDGDGIVG